MITAPARRSDVFGQAEQTAHEWLATVARYLGTDDQHRALRVVRAWLHTVRDRLPVESAAHVAAQLPLLWRGLYYDGWQPRQVPVKYDADQFLVTVAQDAALSVDEARQAAAAVTAALEELTSGEVVGHLLAQLPGPLRRLLATGGQHAAAPEPGPAAEPRLLTSGEVVDLPADERLARLERDVQLLAEALGALVGALDEDPTTEPEPARSVAGARRAHQILLSRTAVPESWSGPGRPDVRPAAP